MLAALLFALAPQENVLVILLDDVAQADLDEVAADGWAPNISALAARGIVYRNAFANPVCSPSRRSLHDGRWYFNESGVGCDPLPGAEPPVADVLLGDLAVSEGLTAALFGKWHLGGNPYGGAYQKAPLAHGYSLWQGTPGNVNSCGGTSYNYWVFVDSNRTSISTQYNPGVIENRLVSWWDSTHKRFALWSMSLAHGRFHRPPNAFLPPGYPGPPADDERKLYLAMIAAIDVQVGRVLEHVDLASTLVILLGDNGTPQNVAPDPARAKASTFERGIRVPFLIAGVGLPPGESNRLVHIADVLPTVAHYLRAPPPAGIDGLSVLGKPEHAYVICGQGGGPTVPGDWCARTTRFKLRRTGIAPAITEEFYDLVADPDETAPLPERAFHGLRVFLRGRLQAEGVP
ncbi:MAG: sulfatase-like hydrolase/transferase [Planctomycetes bacterium]|nr:sulfatase-like hydrolase/transferase [Planctomycetota bacterium]